MYELAFDRLHDGITAADDLIYKALGLRQVTRIARLEVQLRRYLLAKWEEHARAAEIQSGKMATQLKSPSQISRAVQIEMEKWAKEVLPRTNDTIERIYRLAREAGWKKANKKTTASLSYSTPNLQEVVAKADPPVSQVIPVFDLVDEEAVEAMQEHQVFWIGEHYDNNFGATVANTTKETMLEAGKDRVAAGKLMRERIEGALHSFAIPGQFRGSAAKYMEGLAANAATTARSFGQMKSFVDAGVVKYEWNSVNDRRVCSQCSHMDGKIFTVDQGTSVMENEMEAKTPEGVKRAHPFIGESKAGIAHLRSLSPTKGRGSAKESAKLAGAGIAMPPLHFRCFAPNVPVWTKRGLIPISQIAIGDIVLTHRLRWKRVTHLMASWHSGVVQSIDDVVSTIDHPFYILRNGIVTFDGLKKGDRIGSPKRKSLGKLCQLRRSISSSSIKGQDSHSMFGQMYSCEQSESGENFKQEEENQAAKIATGAICQRQTSQSGMSTMWENRAYSAFKGEEIQILLQGLQEQGNDQRQMDQLFRMYQEILDNTCIDSCGLEDLFIWLQRDSMEKTWQTERFGSERIFCGREKSDVWEITGTRQVGNGYYPMARRDSSQKFMGGASCAGIDGPERAIPLRATEIQAKEGNDLQARFLSAEIGYLDRSQGLEKGTRQADRSTFSTQTSLDRTERDERIEFIPFEATQIRGWRGYVWNLTVEDDESFLVGRRGLMVHNCRCTVDISVEAGSWEI